MKKQLTKRAITAIMGSAILAFDLLSVSAFAADGSINKKYLGIYHATDNNDAFVSINEDNVILVAYYYVGGVYVRGVITNAEFGQADGTSNFSLRADEIKICEKDGTYTDQVQRYFFSQGKMTNSAKIKAHGKTYSR